MSSIKTKILSIYIFLISLIFIVAIVSIYSLYNLNKAVDGLIASNYKSIMAATDMLDSLERQDSSELIYIQVEDEKSIRSFYENQKRFITCLTKAKDNITENSEKRVMNDISNNYMRYIESFSKLQQTKNTLGIIEAGNFYNNEVYPLFLSVKESCEELLELNEVAMFASKEDASHTTRNQIYFTAVLSLTLIVSGLVVSILYTKKIVDPIHALIYGIKSIKTGSKHREIEITTKDEVGALANEFNNMIKRLTIYDEGNIRKLITEKNKSLAIVKSISDPVIVTDNNLNIILVNKSSERVFDIEEEKVVGNHFLESIDNKRIFDKIKSITKGDCNEENQVITIKKLEEVLYYIPNIAPIFDNEKNVIGVVTVLQDITGVRELAQMKSDFISTISHELRTPLTSIIMGTELLLTDGIGKLNEDQVEITEAMDEDSKLLLTIVNDLLDLSKLESGKMVMKFEYANIRKVIENSIRYFYDVAEDKGIKLYCNITEELPLVRIDMNKIISVINNIITNGIKFTKSGDKINVSAIKENNFIKVIVEDTGIGIPVEYREKIFDKFVQVDQVEVSERGTGLGLTISKEFIKRHGGEIWVENGVNSGSRFIFTLPL